MEKRLKFLYNFTIIGVCIVIVVSAKLNRSALPYVLIPFTALSGYTAYLHARLPKNTKMKVKYPAFSIFSIHPYVTFLFLLIITVSLLVFTYVRN